MMGIGFTGLLTIVFITLKLIHKVDWSWWQVTAPLWLGFIFYVVLYTGYEIFKMRYGIKGK